MNIGRGFVVLAVLSGLLGGCATSTVPDGIAPNLPVTSPPAPSPAPSPAPVPGPVVVLPPAPVDNTAEGMDPTQPRAKTVKLWYGTNRKPTQPFLMSNPFGSERDTKLNYGVAEVFIPKSHETGSLGSYSFQKRKKDEPIRFSFARPLDDASYWSSLKTTQKKINPNHRVVLVFIHGYNNSFIDAARRTAQIWAGLNLKGIPAFYSWPSRASTLAYTADEATVDYSEKYLAEFLQRLRQEVGPSQPIHLIAHSMGNRALLRVAIQLQNQLRFGQIILAAPDVDADFFHDMAKVYSKISERTTLYVSKTDKPVKFSQKVHDRSRVGAPPAFARVDGIDTVEVVSRTGLLEMGHSYFAEHAELLGEIGHLITHNPSSGYTYVGSRLDRRSDCAKEQGGATQESCWRIVVKK